MRLLFLTPQPPYPPHAGNALRTLGLLEGLHKAGCKIDLITFVEADQPDPASTPAAELCDRIVSITTPKRALRQRLRDLILTGNADMARRFFSDRYADELSQQLLTGGDYDLIQFEGLEMAVYLPVIRSIRPRAKVVYGAANAEFDLQRLIYRTDRRMWRRLPGTIYSLIQWQRLIRFERRVCESVTQVIATSQTDADAFKRLAPKTAVSVVPNGIYVQEYMQSASQLDLGSAALLFTGTMGYRPNVDAVLWFADQILGRIREAVPEARLFVVGKNPHRRLEPLRQRADVEITGYVQDVTPFLHSSAVYVAPLRMGSGTRLKLLQAMAAQRAIVSTTIGAQGLNARPGQELIIADDVANFAQGVIGLLRDPARRETLGRAAQSFVCEKYDWSVIVPRLLKVYRELGVG